MGFLTDLLFPPRCALCGRPCGDRSAPCRSCQADAALWLTGADAVRRGSAFALCVSAGAYRGALRDSVRQFKFLCHAEYARVYGPILAGAVRRTLAERYDTIAWMPVSAGTLATRGYDQARLLAEETAAALGDHARPLLRKVRDTAAQSSLGSAGERWGNVAGVYAVLDPERVRGRRILLIDDILTTGATLEEGARTLRAAGAAEVVAATLCRAMPRSHSEPV